MVDEPRDVAVDAAVNHRAIRELEAPDVPRADVAPLPLQALVIRDLLARVVDDALVLRDAGRRIDAPSVDTRSTFGNHSQHIKIHGHRRLI